MLFVLVWYLVGGYVVFVAVAGRLLTVRFGSV